MLSAKGRRVTRNHCGRDVRLYSSPQHPPPSCTHSQKTKRWQASCGRLSSFILQQQWLMESEGPGMQASHPRSYRAHPQASQLRSQNSSSHPRDRWASGNCCKFNLLEFKAKAIPPHYLLLSTETEFYRQPTHLQPGWLSCASASITYFLTQTWLISEPG